MLDGRRYVVDRRQVVMNSATRLPRSPAVVNNLSRTKVCTAATGRELIADKTGQITSAEAG